VGDVEEEQLARISDSEPASVAAPSAIPVRFRNSRRPTGDSIEKI
jgi:hypothetical protein